MDHKTWLWKKKSNAKTLVAADKVTHSPRGNEETLLMDKAEYEKDLKILEKKLSSALSECNAKDEYAKKQAKFAQEAIADREKAEAELGRALQQKVDSEERHNHLDGALRECMQQLRFVREEQEKRIHDAVTKTSIESEKMRVVLEEKLTETLRRLSKIGAENTQLSEALLGKERAIENLKEKRAQAEADFAALMTRLDIKEKENTSLKYEVRVLEKELEIRNEEREFNRQTADVAHKQHLESVKKIAKLDSECQKLRLLVRKRLPGPAAMAKMRNEVELLGRDSSGTRRRKSNPSSAGSMDFAVDTTPDTPSRRISFLTEQLCAMEEENRTLKDTLEQKTKELQFFRITYVRAASKLSQVEAQLEESSRGQMAVGLCGSDMGSDDKVSCAELWASALMSELGHLTNGEQTGTSSRKSLGTSEISMMDDFLEMEKLAIVSIDKPCGNSHHISQDSKGGNSTEAAGKEIVPLSINQLGLGGERYSSPKTTNEKIQPNLSTSIRKTIELIDGISLPLPDYGLTDTVLGKVDSGIPPSEKSTGYMVRVFQWKTSELIAVRQKFIQTCNDLLNGSADLERFSTELASALEWIVNHCFSLQDVSSMSYEIKKQFDWDESRSENEVVECGMSSQFSDAEKFPVSKPQLCTPIVSPWKDHNFSQLEELQPKVRNQTRRSKNELENVESDSYKRESLTTIPLQTPGKTIKSLRKEFEILRGSKGVSEEQIEHDKMVQQDLDTQHTTAKAEMDEDHHKCSTTDKKLEKKDNSCEELESTFPQLNLPPESITKHEVPESDNEQEEKQLRTDWEVTAATEKLAECQETILNLGKQLKAMTSPRDSSRSHKVISVSSVAIVTATSPKKNINQRFSLLDKMLAEDNDESLDLRSLITHEVPSKPASLLDDNFNTTIGLNGTRDGPNRFLNSNGIKSRENGAGVNSLAIVPISKTEGGLWKKLLWSRKKGNSKKTPFLCAT